MGRAVGVVIAGWCSGFLVAIAVGASRANNPRLASALSGWAVAGAVVTALLLVSIAVSKRMERRRAAREAAPKELIVFPTAAAQAAASAAAAEAAAKIAELEARLALEQRQLDAAAEALAATESAAAPVGVMIPDAVPDENAAELEPVLRQEVLDTFTALVGSAEPERAVELAGHLEVLFEKAR